MKSWKNITYVAGFATEKKPWWVFWRKPRVFPTGEVSRFIAVSSDGSHFESGDGVTWTAR